MIYKLHKNKTNNFLTALSGYYTEEYAQDMFDLYLKDELIKNDAGRVENSTDSMQRKIIPRIWHWLTMCSVLIAKVH